jgi:release factor glutamine methyltransferase
MQNSTHTIGYLLSSVRQSLADLYPAREARAICHLLFENILGVAPAALYISLDAPVDAAREQRIAAAAAQLRQGRPVQQVLGSAEFYGLRFLVSEHVLTPRPETEELVEWALKSADAGAALRVLDIGTGSGCIAVALAKYLPCAAAYAWDISAEALSIARKNAALNGVQVRFEERDILREAPAISAQPYDLIVSNPPYVCESEKAQMHSNVLRYEPHVALFVGDDNPLIFYDAIAAFAQKSLSESGAALVEVNEKLGREVADVFTRSGFLSVELRRDVNGKPRMIKAKR